MKNVEKHPPSVVVTVVVLMTAAVVCWGAGIDGDLPTAAAQPPGGANADDSAMNASEYRRRAVAELVACITDGSSAARQAAARALPRLGAEAVPAVLPLVASDQREIRRIALDVITRTEGLAAPWAANLAAYLDTAAADDEDTRWGIETALAMMGAEAVSALLDVLADTDSAVVKTSVAKALATMLELPADPRLRATAESWLASEANDRAMLVAASMVLRKIGAFEPLVDVLLDTSRPESARVLTAHALSDAGAAIAPVLPRLIGGMASADERLMRVLTVIISNFPKTDRDAAIFADAPAEGLDAMVAAMDSGMVGAAVRRAVVRIGLPMAPRLVAVLETASDDDDDDDDWRLRSRAAEALSQIPNLPPTILTRLGELLANTGTGAGAGAKSREIAYAVLNAIRNPGEHGHLLVPPLIAWIEANRESEIVINAVSVVADIGAPAAAAVPLLAELLANESVAINAMVALRAIGQPAAEVAIPALMVALAKEPRHDPRSPVWSDPRISAARTLAVLAPDSADAAAAVAEMFASLPRLRDHHRELLAVMKAFGETAAPHVALIFDCFSDADLRAEAVATAVAMGPGILDALVTTERRAANRANVICAVLREFGPAAAPVIPALNAWWIEDRFNRRFVGQVFPAIGAAALPAVLDLYAAHTRDALRELADTLNAVERIPPETMATVLALTSHNVEALRIAAQKAVARTGADAVAPVAARLADANARIRLDAVHLLESMADAHGFAVLTPAAAALVEYLATDTDPTPRAAKLLAMMDVEPHTTAGIEWLRDRAVADPPNRWDERPVAAIDALLSVLAARMAAEQTPAPALIAAVESATAKLFEMMASDSMGRRNSAVGTARAHAVTVLPVAVAHLAAGHVRAGNAVIETARSIVNPANKMDPATIGVALTALRECLNAATATESERDQAACLLAEHGDTAGIEWLKSRLAAADAAPSSETRYVWGRALVLGGDMAGVPALRAAAADEGFARREYAIQVLCRDADDWSMWPTDLPISAARWFDFAGRVGPRAISTVPALLDLLAAHRAELRDASVIHAITNILAPR